MAGLGFGYSVRSLKLLIQNVLKIETIVDNAWVQRFFERHSDLAIRKAHAMEKARIGGANYQSVKEYFDLLGLAFQLCSDVSNGTKLESNRVFCCDEIGFDSVECQAYIIAQKGVRKVTQAMQDRINHISIMSFASASGWTGNEYFILPGSRKRVKFENNLVEATVSSQYVKKSFWVRTNRERSKSCVSLFKFAKNRF